MKKLSSSGLFVDTSHVDFKLLVSMWPRSLAGDVVPVGASVLGDLFFQRPEGNIEKLDVLAGGVHHAASSLDEFELLMNSRYWRDVNLMGHRVSAAAGTGLRRKRGEFFGFVKHPSRSGRIDWASLTCLEAGLWHAICAKALDGAHAASSKRKRRHRLNELDQVKAPPSGRR